MSQEVGRFVSQFLKELLYATRAEIDKRGDRAMKLSDFYNFVFKSIERAAEEHAEPAWEQGFPKVMVRMTVKPDPRPEEPAKAYTTTCLAGNAEQYESLIEQGWQEAHAWRA